MTRKIEHVIAENTLHYSVMGYVLRLRGQPMLMLLCTPIQDCSEAMIKLQSYIVNFLSTLINL